MGYVIVVSLPLILFILIVALACFLLGRARGRNGAAPPVPQYFGPPVPPIQAQYPAHEKAAQSKSHDARQPRFTNLPTTLLFVCPSTVTCAGYFFFRTQRK